MVQRGHGAMGFLKQHALIWHSPYLAGTGIAEQRRNQGMAPKDVSKPCNPNKFHNGRKGLLSPASPPEALICTAMSAHTDAHFCDWLFNE